ncbi:hypothetical protein E4T42_05535 [Aureobasidium subglaciale]|nr:hypothetical protein E4T42_05535 [Aureobasidium subglaciale]
MGCIGSYLEYSSPINLSVSITLLTLGAIINSGSTPIVSQTDHISERRQASSLQAIQLWAGIHCFLLTSATLRDGSLMLLGVVTIGPWALLLVYDFLFYVYRSCAYHIPLFGGKAQGKRRPHAPSLTERPNGEKRDAPKVPIPAATTGIHHHENGSEKRALGQA